MSGRALVVGSGPLTELGWAFQYEADESESWAPFLFSAALEELSWDVGLQGRLAAAGGEPWRMVLDAVRTVNDLRAGV